MSANRALFKSEKQDWQTPPEILKLVCEVAPIAFDPAPANWDRSFDGLKVNWIDRATPGGLVYCNPPYGRALSKWTHWAADQKWWSTAWPDTALESISGILLVPARPDTKWWHENILRAEAICFWKGRIKFVGAENSAPFPSAFAYFGARRERFKEVFSKKGWVVYL
jgi:DNA N-6-adenine-methyltransferase (Dam)